MNPENQAKLQELLRELFAETFAASQTGYAGITIGLNSHSVGEMKPEFRAYFGDSAEIVESTSLDKYFEGVRSAFDNHEARKQRRIAELKKQLATLEGGAQ
jgi:hypothetical protein